MEKTQNTFNLGSYVLLTILNNKLYKQGLISEVMRNKIMSEIKLDYKKAQKV